MRCIEYSANLKCIWRVLACIMWLENNPISIDNCKAAKTDGERLGKKSMLVFSRSFFRKEVLKAAGLE
jgi:hypothetical protein